MVSGRRHRWPVPGYADRPVPGPGVGVVGRGEGAGLVLYRAVVGVRGPGDVAHVRGRGSLAGLAAHKIKPRRWQYKLCRDYSAVYTLPKRVMSQNYGKIKAEKTLKLKALFNRFDHTIV